MHQVDGLEIFQVRGVRQNATATQCLKDWKAMHVWFENRKMAGVMQTKLQHGKYKHKH